MAIYTNTFEGGSLGDSITAVNSGGLSGDAFGTVQPTSGTLWTYSASAAIGGSVGAERLLDVNSGYLRGDDLSPSGRGGMRRPLYIEALPSASLIFGQIRSATDVFMCNIILRTSGRIRIAPQGTDIIASESPILTVGQTYWVELILTPGASTTTGRAELLVTDITGTVIHTYDTGLTCNFATIEPPARYRMGGSSTSTGWTVDRMDDLRWGSIASGWIGTYASGPTPAISEGKRYVADFRNSTAGSGGALTFTIAYVSGPDNSAGIAEPIEGLFHIPMDANLPSVYTVTVHEGGQTATYDVNVPVTGTTPASPDSVQRLYYDGAAWL